MYLELKINNKLYYVMCVIQQTNVKVTATKYA